MERPHPAPGAPSPARQPRRRLDDLIVWPDGSYCERSDYSWFGTDKPINYTVLAEGTGPWIEFAYARGLIHPAREEPACEEPAMTHEELYHAVIARTVAYLDEHFPGQSANIGWGEHADDEGIAISTKVGGRHVVSAEGAYADGQITVEHFELRYG